MEAQRGPQETPEVTPPHTAGPPTASQYLVLDVGVTAQVYEEVQRLQLPIFRCPLERGPAQLDTDTSLQACPPPPPAPLGPSLPPTLGSPDQPHSGALGSQFHCCSSAPWSYPSPPQTPPSRCAPRPPHLVSGVQGQPPQVLHDEGQHGHVALLRGAVQQAQAILPQSPTVVPDTRTQSARPQP